MAGGVPWRRPLHAKAWPVPLRDSSAQESLQYFIDFIPSLSEAPENELRDPTLWEGRRFLVQNIWKVQFDVSFEQYISDEIPTLDYFVKYWTCKRVELVRRLQPTEGILSRELCLITTL